MMTSVVLLVVLGVAINALAQIFTDSRIDRPFVVKSLAAIVGFCAYCAIGVFVTIALASRAAAAGVALGAAVVLFFLLWIVEGALCLIRNVPRLKQIPKWIGERFCWLDVVILTASGLALVAALMIE